MIPTVMTPLVTMAGTAMSEYDPTRRVPRGHRRVTRQGGETRDVSLDAQELESGTRRRQRQEAEDRRILRELPPHWDIFSEQK